MLVGWLVCVGLGECPCLDTQCLLWILLSAFVVSGNKETSVYWKRHCKGAFFFLKFGKYAECLPILSRWASGMKGSELINVFTDDSYLKGVESTNGTYPQFSPLKSSETSNCRISCGLRCYCTSFWVLFCMCCVSSLKVWLLIPGNMLFRMSQYTVYSSGSILCLGREWELQACSVTECCGK